MKGFNVNTDQEFFNKIVSIKNDIQRVASMFQDQFSIKSYILGYLYNTRSSGETVIKCKSQIIGTKDIEDILSLLHSDYKDLGMTITVHKNKLYAFIKLLNPLCKEIDFGTFKNVNKGLYVGNHFHGKIDLFPYNHVDSQNENRKMSIKLYVIFDLLHEVRHAYQLKYKESKYVSSLGCYINGGDYGYSEQWIERDANSFATRFMNKHHDEINEILGIEYEWENTWGYFRRLHGVETRRYKRIKSKITQ